MLVPLLLALILIWLVIACYRPAINWPTISQRTFNLFAAVMIILAVLAILIALGALDIARYHLLR